MKHPKGYWKNKENMMEEAKKYSTKEEFQKGNLTAFLAAYRYGYIDDMDWLITKGQKKMLEQLGYKGKITKDIFNKFENIRNLRNKVAHGYLRNPEEKAFEVHKDFFDISVFFYQKYKDKDI